MSSGPRRIVFALSYHRIGTVSRRDPSSMLHTVCPRIFRRQIAALSRLGRFVSLNQVRAAEGLGRWSFALTFDDVSRSVLSVAPFLRERSIPFAICPCTTITDHGFGVRDKVYRILAGLPAEEIRQVVRKEAGDEAVSAQKAFSFYRFAKRADLDGDWLDERIIDPLLDRVPGARQQMAEARAYLGWEDIRRHFLGDGLVTVVNHGWRHRPMDRFSDEQIAEDVEQSGARFRAELGMEPAYYAVPFGRPAASVAAGLSCSLRPRGYRGVLWVARGGYVASPSADLMHLPRIHAPEGLWKLLRRFPSYLRHRTASAVAGAPGEAG